MKKSIKIMVRTLIMATVVLYSQVIFSADKSSTFDAKTYEINNSEIVKLRAFKMQIKSIKKIKFITLAELGVKEASKLTSPLLAKSF